MSKAKGPQSSGNEEQAFHALEARLERLAADQASIEAEANELAEAPGLARVEETLERTWSEDLPARRSPILRLGRWLVPLAAAAVVALLVLDRDPQDPSPLDRPSGTVLNTSALGELALAYEAGLTVITWSGPDDGRFTVTVRDAEQGPPLLEGHATRERKLVLEASRIAGWPERLFVEVELVEDDGTRRTSSTVLERH